MHRALSDLLNENNPLHHIFCLTNLIFIQRLYILRFIVSFFVLHLRSIYGFIYSLFTLIVRINCKNDYLFTSTKRIYHDE